MAVFRTLDTLDPWHNLAVERYLFETIPDSSHSALLWRDSRCVVVGRHQNPWIECDLDRMAQDGVPLVRRISGGGAVFHDPGNVNFSFIGTESTYDLDRHFGVVIDALQSLGISVRRNERNDLLIGDDKFSGSAYRHTRHGSLHHGTLLLCSDLEVLSAYLMLGDAERGVAGADEVRRAKAVTESRGISSVRSRVINLCEVRPELDFSMLADAVRRAYESEYGESSAGGPGPGSEVFDDRAAAVIARHSEELKSWQWRYGKTPSFTCGAEVADERIQLRVIVTVRHGAIEGIRPDPPPPDERLAAECASVESMLLGAAFMQGDIRRRTRGLRGVGGRLAEAVSSIAAPGESVVPR